MPRQIYTVELDGMRYDIEGDRDPTEQDVRALVGNNIPTQTQKPFDAMGLVRRAVNPIGGPFMEGIPAMAEAVNKISDITSEAGKKYIGKPVAEFATRNIPTNIPKVGQDIIGAIPNISPAVKPIARVTNPREVLRTAIEEGAGMAVDPRSYLIPTALGGPEAKLLMKGMGGAAKGMLTPTEAAGRSLNIGKFISGKGLPKQAETVADELENMRGLFGEQKSAAIAKVANKPIKNIGELSNDLADLGLSSETAIKLKDPMYKIKFLADGSVEPTVGNMDRVARALGDMLSPSEWDKFSNVSKSTIKRAYRLVRESITKTAPGTKGSVDAFHYFLDNIYNPVIRKVVQGGRNVEKPLRDALAMGAEQTTKQAISGAGQISPEIAKAIRYIKNYRRTMAGLKGAGVVGVGSGIWKGLSGN